MSTYAHTSTHTGQANQLIEIEFQSAIHYQNPFKAITLDAIFTMPTGEICRVPAFWAGNQRWCVRYASALLGTHQFVTACSDTQNTGLDLQQGQITISAYLGDNPLIQHGAIRVADDQRHFAHADGTPFFWLGDTWWMGLTKRLTWPQDFQALTVDRKSKGFNVVQIVAGLYPDMAAFDPRGMSTNGFPWESDYSAIRPAFFDEADQRIYYLVQQGIVPCILGSWGYYLPWLGIENMKLHWRYLIARWGALPVVWAASGEQTMPWYLDTKIDKEQNQLLLKNGWSAIIQMIREVDGFKRLLTTHPITSARESVNNPKLLDFEMQQTGHHANTQHHAKQAIQGWLEAPIMPVISAESRYEALEIKPSVQTKDVRQAFWAHLLNSGCAGHTYGANGIWQVNLPDAPFGQSPKGNNWGSMPWQQAMALPAAKQLTLAKQFLVAHPWEQLQALALTQQNHAKIYSNIKSKLIKKIIARFLPNFFIPTPIAAAISTDSTFAMYYVVTHQTFKLDMEIFSKPLYASWFDPTVGTEKLIATHPFSNHGMLHLKTPGKNATGDQDWVLLFKSTT